MPLELWEGLPLGGKDFRRLTQVESGSTILVEPRRNDAGITLLSIFVGC